MIICICHNISYEKLQQTIIKCGCTTHQEVMEHLKAGTQCGYCINDIQVALVLNTPKLDDV